MFWSLSTLDKISSSVFLELSPDLPATPPHNAEQHMPIEPKNTPSAVSSDRSTVNRYSTQSLKSTQISFFSLSQLTNIPLETFDPVLKFRRKTMPGKELTRPNNFSSQYKRNTK